MDDGQSIAQKAAERQAFIGNLSLTSVLQALILRKLLYALPGEQPPEDEMDEEC